MTMNLTLANAPRSSRFGSAILIAPLSLAICLLSCCSPPNEAREASEGSTIEVKNTKNPTPFTKDLYNKFILMDAHGETYQKNVFTITGTVTAVNASLDEGVGKATSSLSIKAKPWADSVVTATFVFSQSQIQSVVAQKPGDTVRIKAKLQDVGPRRISFIGSVINQE